MTTVKPTMAISSVNQITVKLRRQDTEEEVIVIFAYLFQNSALIIIGAACLHNTPILVPEVVCAENALELNSPGENSLSLDSYIQNSFVDHSDFVRFDKLMKSVCRCRFAQKLD